MIADPLHEELKAAEEAFAKYDFEAALDAYKRALSVVNRRVDMHKEGNTWADINLKIVDVLDKSRKWLDALMFVGTLLNTAHVRGDKHL
ncbi:MAG: hypothetical protein KAT70_08980, partial [Thermoplasmata archaeon]|nr:hypothetical protein [Thermoplasmata archaeon]